MGLPTWSEAGLTLAKSTQKELNVPVVGLATQFPELRGREEMLEGQYFLNVQTKTKKYTPLIRPDDKPAIQLNKAIMDRHRPGRKKFYFDPSKHRTYLDQLGIKYRTVRTTATNQQQ